MATVEAEANYRISNAERKAMNHIKTTNDELRKLQKENETKSLTIAKMMRKRKNSTMIGDGNVSLVSSPMMVTEPTPIVHTNDKVGRYITHVSPMQSKDEVSSSTTTTTTMMMKKKSFLSNKTLYESHEYETDNFTCNSQIALHLLHHFDNVNHILSHINGINSEHNEAATSVESNHDSQSIIDETKIRQLLHLLASSNGCITTAVQNKKKYVSINIIVKELVCLITIRGTEMLKKSDKRHFEYRLKFLLLSLSTLNEICTVVSEARNFMRKCICNSNKVDNSLNGTKNEASPSSFLSCTTDRIEGLSSVQSERLKSSVGNIRKTMKVPLKGHDITKCSWDQDQISSVCLEFFNCLSRFMFGSMFDYDKDAKITSTMRQLVKSLKDSCSMHLLILTCDAPREGTNCGSERIWQLLFEVLFPLSNCSEGIFTALSSQFYSISRHNYLKTYENNDMESQAPSAKGLDIQDFLPNRILMFQLLHQILRSSKSVRYQLFQMKMNNISATNIYHENVTIARNLCAIMLDELQMHLLPALKQHVLRSNTTDTSQEGYKYDFGDQLLSLTWYIIRLLILLCESRHGLQLIRTQMKVGDDLDSPSGVAVIHDVLAFVVDTYVQDHSILLNHTQLNQITNSCITFFYHLLKQFNDPTKGKDCSESQFVSIISDSERSSSLESYCRMVIHFQSIDPYKSFADEITKQRARIILEQF